MIPISDIRRPVFIAYYDWFFQFRFARNIVGEVSDLGNVFRHFVVECIEIVGSEDSFGDAFDEGFLGDCSPVFVFGPSHDFEISVLVFGQHSR